MRTTVDIDEDVLLATREIARLRSESIGKVLSDLARQALTDRTMYETRNGLPLIPVREGGGLVTMEVINRLRDEVE